MAPVTSPRTRALVVGTSAATRAALLSYLRNAGIDADGCDGARGLARACRGPGAATKPTDAVVVFPDDLSPAGARAALRAAGAVGPEVLVLVVTSSPQRFGAPANGVPSARVLPKPVFGWTLVDAIRAHVEKSGEEAS